MIKSIVFKRMLLCGAVVGLVFSVETTNSVIPSSTDSAIDEIVFKQDSSITIVACHCLKKRRKKTS